MTYKIEPMKGKGVLVLGGLGFIGSNVSNRCVALGADVTVFDALIKPYGGDEFNISEIKGKVKLLKQDMRNVKQIEAAVKGTDYIFNCAGQVSHVDSMTDPYT